MPNNPRHQLLIVADSTMGLLNYIKPKGVKEQGGLDMQETANAEPVRRVLQPTSRAKSFGASRSGVNSPSGYATPGYATPGGPNDSRADVRSLAQSEKWEEVDSFRHMTMCDHIYKQQQQNLWIDDREEYEQGVLLRRNGGGYVASPPGLLQGRFAASVMEMNASVSDLFTTTLEQSPLTSTLVRYDSSMASHYYAAQLPKWS